MPAGHLLSLSPKKVDKEKCLQPISPLSPPARPHGCLKAKSTLSGVLSLFVPTGDGKNSASRVQSNKFELPRRSLFKPMLVIGKGGRPPLMRSLLTLPCGLPPGASAIQASLMALGYCVGSGAYQKASAPAAGAGGEVKPSFGAGTPTAFRPRKCPAGMRRIKKHTGVAGMRKGVIKNGREFHHETPARYRPQ